MYQNSTNNSVSDGVTSIGKIITSKISESHENGITGLRKIQDYAKEDYCISCAYFQQTKGNFGRCTVLKQEKRYDGTKKGTGCKVWRINTILLDFLSKIPINRKIKVKEPEQKTFRENYNAKARAHYISVKSKQEKNNEKTTMVNSKNWHRGLPYEQTSDIRKKNGYFFRRYDHHIIDYALLELKKRKDAKIISQEIKQNFGAEVSMGTVKWWAESFLGMNLRKPNIKTYFRLKRERGEINLD